jgi:hypothetical protein
VDLVIECDTLKNNHTSVTVKVKQEEEMKEKSAEQGIEFG